MPGYDFHPEAEIDLLLIWEDLADDNAAAADRVLAEIHSALETLVAYPRIGHRRSDLTSRPLRFIRVRNYLIAYTPDETPLWVIAVLHGRRSPRVLAAILRGREEPPPRS